MENTIKTDGAYQMLDFVIVGPAHGATGWASRLLTKAGYPCGHEKIFNIEGFIQTKQYVGDSSWLATGYSAETLRYCTKHIFAVQRPLEEVVRSMLKRWRDWPIEYQECYQNIAGGRPLDLTMARNCVQAFWEKIDTLEPEVILYTHQPEIGLGKITDILMSEKVLDGTNK